MKYLLFRVGVMLLLTVQYFPQGMLTGKVTDRRTKQPVPMATVLLQGTAYGCVTDSAGSFSIPGIAPGRYTLRVSSVGYALFTDPDLIIAPARPAERLIELAEEAYSLGSGVVVTGGYFRNDPGSSVSVHTLGYEEIRRAPGGAEDISRVVLSLPGVLTSSDDRNDLLVRGGNPTENLNIIDNIEVPNINHFGTQGASGGPIGMVNNNFVREVVFSSGGFPVKYGDKLSSVLDIQLREGSRDRFQGDIIMNMAGFGVNVEGPLAAKGSWMLSARRSFLDIIQKMNTTSVVIVPEYSNFQLKAVYDIVPGHQLSLIGLAGVDKAYFAEGQYNLDTYFLDYKITSSQDQYAAGINLRSLWGKYGYSVITLSNTYNKFYSGITHARQGYTFYRNASFEREYHLKAEANLTLSPALTVTAGGAYKLVNFNHGMDYRGDTTYTVNGGIIDTVVFAPLHYYTGINTSKAAVYAQAVYRAGQQLELNAGLRYDRFAFISSPGAFAWRAGASWYFSPVTVVNCSYGVVTQTPPYIWLTADPASSGLSHMKAAHAILGFEHYFSEDLKLSVEAYHKGYSSIPVSSAIPQFIASNGGSDYGAFIARNLISNGTGTVSGAELALQKKLKDGVYGIVSYGKSSARFTALDGIARPGNFDVRDVFTIVAGYIPSDTWECSIKWRYAGGRPYTPFDPVLSAMFKRGVEDYSRLNQLRLPAYHRLDIRFDYRSRYEHFSIVTYLDLQNAYFRYNVYEYQWHVKENRQFATYQWRFFPVAGLNIEF